MDNELKNRVYKAFDPAPLEQDQNDLYVDLDAVRGDEDSNGPIDRLAERIRLSSKPQCRILTGHRGSGKTTELHRLQSDLESNTPDKYFVAFCGVKDDIDLNDVDFPDILMTIIRQTSRQLKERAGIVLKPGYFRHYFTRFKDYLGSDVELGKIGLEAGMFKLGGVIKNSPEARHKIREGLEPETNNLLNAANDVLSDAILQLKKNNYKDLIIIVDDLDKMVLREHRTADCSTGEYLFINREPQLHGFNCHMIYTMPLPLAYSSKEQTISNLYGGYPPVIPMVRISNCPPDVQIHKPGYTMFREVIRKRLVHAGLKCEDVFESIDIETELIRLSGGQPRELMILIREAIIGGGLPICKHAIERAAREGRRAYARQLHAGHWPVIRAIQNNGAMTTTEENDAVLRELLDNRAILQYSNDKEWYGVNPLVSIPDIEIIE